MLSSKEVYDIIVQKIKEQQPFGLIRIGDGESMSMKYPHKKNGIHYVTNRQFGYVPSDEDLLFISGLLKKAYMNADVIGVPTKRHRHISKWWRMAESTINNINDKVKNTPKCSIDVHSELFEQGLLDKIIKSYKCVYLIGGRDIEAAFKKKYGIETVHSFVVSPEQKFEGKKTTVAHYPTQFKQVNKWIHKQGMNGCLCLVGAGILGKHYVAECRNNGAIAVDVGHLMDVWAGRVTRGAERGIDVYNDKNKL